MRVVLDVNVWISGLLWGGNPGQLLSLARNQQIVIYCSDELLLELETTLKRAKFQKRIHQRSYTVEYLMSVARGFSECCVTTTVNASELRDPKDRKILEAALAATAEVLVTGDQDLLVLSEFEGISILTPAEFLKRHFLSN